MNRCTWAKHPLEIEYHDNEWGVPVTDDIKHFEFFVLDTFQAGLSWLTVLRERHHFRKAFRGFNISEVAGFGDKEILELLGNENIIRNRQKILATINNAGCFLKLSEEHGSFNSYVWSFVQNETIERQSGIGAPGNI